MPTLFSLSLGNMPTLSVLRTLITACLLAACSGGRQSVAVNAGCQYTVSHGASSLHALQQPEGRVWAALKLPRLRGGGTSLAGTGRVADLWDVHKFSSREMGMVAVFRHSRLGTALELTETRAGLVVFVENDSRNASFAMVHGRARSGDERRNRGYTPLVRQGLTWWDDSEGFQAPDTLEALRDEGVTFCVS